MGAATVRAAVQSYIAGGNILGLGYVWKAPPYWADPSQARGWPGQGYSAAAFVNLTRESEDRITLPAPQPLLPQPSPIGNKVIKYSAQLIVIFQYYIPTGFGDGDSDLFDGPDAWVEQCDVLLDSILALMRADPNFGNPSVIFQAAQDPGDLAITRDPPLIDAGGGLIHAWHAIDFTVREIITA